MAWTQIAVADGYAAASGTQVSTSTALNVAAGDLMVASCTWNGAAAGDAITVDENDGTDTFTTESGTLKIQGTQGHEMAWLVLGSADASFTVRFTLNNAGTQRGITVYQFRPDAGETVTQDGVNSGNGASGVLNSGAVATTGTDEVVIGGGREANGSGYTTWEIDAVAADGHSDNSGGWATTWFKVLTATDPDVEATATATDGAWVCGLLAFKSTASGASVAQTMPAMDTAMKYGTMIGRRYI